MVLQVDKRTEGLRTLAHMIALAYLRDIRNDSNDKQFLGIENQKESAEEKDVDKQEPS